MPLIYRFTKTGTFKISAKFIQASSKHLPVELKCSTVTIVEGTIKPEETCFEEQDFHLTSSNSTNHSQSTALLLLPYSLQHNLKPEIVSRCSKDDFLFSYYLLSLDSSLWKYSRLLQRYSNPSLPETFVNQYCAELTTESDLTIAARTVPHGYYLAVYTVSLSSNPADFRQFIQPIEIIRSDLVTEFDGNQTIDESDQDILMNFYSTATDPDRKDFDRRKLNFTLFCYPESSQSKLFQPNMIPLGSSRPTDTNPLNQIQTTIEWSKFNPIFRQNELNLQILEHQCFSLIEKKPEMIQIDSETKLLKINEHDLNFNNGTLHFILIVRHLIDGRQYVGRFEVDKPINLVLQTDDLSALEGVMENLDDLAAANPKKAVELITGLADKLNEMSSNTVS